MTGNPPYSDLGPLPALIRIVEDQHPPLPANGSPECIDFLLRCFEKVAEKRATASELLEHKWMKSVTEQDLTQQKSHKNIRSSNILTIESTLKSKNIGEIAALTVKT
jgi:serine/threonine protein kinase